MRKGEELSGGVPQAMGGGEESGGGGGTTEQEAESEVASAGVALISNQLEFVSEYDFIFECV